MYLAPDAIAGMLERADADTLATLATFFEHQAERLRGAAAARRQSLKDAETARLGRERARLEFFNLGARLIVLERRYRNADAAMSEMRNRTGRTLEILTNARAMYVREKKRRAVSRRNIAVWKASIAGEDHADIAARVGVTRRQVDRIISDAERRARAR